MKLRHLSSLIYYDRLRKFVVFGCHGNVIEKTLPAGRVLGIVLFGGSGGIRINVITAPRCCIILNPPQTDTIAEQRHIPKLYSKQHITLFGQRSVKIIGKVMGA